MTGSAAPFEDAIRAKLARARAIARWGLALTVVTMTALNLAIHFALIRDADLATRSLILIAGNIGAFLIGYKILESLAKRRARRASETASAIANRDPSVRAAYYETGPYLRFGRSILSRPGGPVAMHPATAAAIARAIPGWIHAMDSSEVMVFVEPPLASATLRAAHAATFAKWLGGQGRDGGAA